MHLTDWKMNMSVAMALILQVAVTVVAPAFDFRTTEPETCNKTSEEIVVCGHRDDEKYRLRVLPESSFEAAPLRAEMGLFGNVKASVDTETVQFSNGSESKRMMLRLKMPF